MKSNNSEFYKVLYNCVAWWFLGPNDDFGSSLSWTLQKYNPVLDTYAIKNQRQLVLNILP